MSQSRAYEYGFCWCSKPIEGTAAPLRLHVAGRDLMIESVAQGVCRSCDFKYYKTDILETIEALLRGNQRERRCNSGPV
jgi:hypothetical protein